MGMRKMSSYRTDVIDYFGSQEAASTLAARIVGYWTNLGYTGVEAWIQVEPIHGSRTYAVRSNLYNGFPPKQPPKPMAVPKKVVPSSVADPLAASAQTADTTALSRIDMIATAFAPEQSAAA